LKSKPTWSNTSGYSATSAFFVLVFSSGLIAGKLVNNRGEVREATAEVEPTTGTVVGVFTTGAAVQVYLIAHAVLAEN